MRPRGHRGGLYPFLRAALCVVVRDLIVFGVLTDMMRGRPAVYATFSSYDEVAHHSGLERADTLEALRKLDQQFGRIERARRYAPRPYQIVVLSDHGQTQGATFKQRNGYGLDELVERSLERGDGRGARGRRRARRRRSGTPFDEATGRAAKQREAPKSGRRRPPRSSCSARATSGCLPDGRDARLTLEEIDERHPRLIAALRAHPHVGWLLVRSREHGAVVLGARRHAYLRRRPRRGRGPAGAVLAQRGRSTCCAPTASTHVADIMVSSFYDPQLEQGCAFEELISFHGGLGGPQTRPFVLYPAGARARRPIVGAGRVHGLLAGWRRALQGDERRPPTRTTPTRCPLPAGADGRGRRRPAGLDRSQHGARRARRRPRSD